MRRVLSLLFDLVLCSVAWHGPSFAVAQEVKLGERGTIQFKESPPQNGAEQLRLRMSAKEAPGPYDVTKETFEILVPKDYKASEPHGLFIWISAGATPNFPKEWEPVLAEKKLIFIGARNSGNPRNVFDRFRMAVDANANLRKLYNVDGRRVYVSGFSGGARVASMLGVCFAEMFSGTICFMGVNFYKDIPAGEGKKWGPNYIPDEQVLALAKKFCRYALVTGTKEMNHENTLGVYEHGFRKEGFASAKVFDIPEQGHSLPAAEWLRKGIEFLDEGK
jgi:dienelactone hydrolase